MDQNIDRVIFDFDGVLLDREIWSVQASQRTPADCGWRLTVEELVERFLGSPRRTLPPLHSTVDGFSWLGHTEALEGKSVVTTIRFFGRARAFFAAQDIWRLPRIGTDNGVNCWAKVFTRCVETLADRYQKVRPILRAAAARWSASTACWPTWSSTSAPT